MNIINGKLYILCLLIQLKKPPIQYVPRVNLTATVPTDPPPGSVHPNTTECRPYGNWMRVPCEALEKKAFDLDHLSEWVSEWVSGWIDRWIGR